MASVVPLIPPDFRNLSPPGVGTLLDLRVKYRENQKAPLSLKAHPSPHPSLGLEINLLGLGSDSESKIVCSLSATKTNSLISRPTHERRRSPKLLKMVNIAVAAYILRGVKAPPTECRGRLTD